MKKLIIFIPIIYLLISSCSEIIDMNLNSANNNRLVVEGRITDELKIQWLRLSRTSDYFVNQQANAEIGAIVSISNEDTLFNLSDINNNGFYTTNKAIAGVPGKTYVLNILLTDGESYTAESFLKPILPMDSINYQYRKTDNPFDDKLYYHINLFVQEPEPIGDYYLWELFIDGIHESDTLRKKTFISDEYINGSYVANAPIYILEDTKIMKDTSMVKIQMLSISKDEYDFKFAILLETDYSGAGFNGPPANIPSNISNGAVGYFGASAVVEDSVLVFKGQNP